MKTIIYLNRQEFGENWVRQRGTDNIIHLTNKYVFALEKLSVTGKVIITIDKPHAEKAVDNNFEFVVDTNNKADYETVWNTIIKVTNEKQNVLQHLV